MASLQISNLEQIPVELLIARVIPLHSSISKLNFLRPSKQVNSLFTQLMNLFTLMCNIDIMDLPQEAQTILQSIIHLCGLAEE